MEATHKIEVTCSEGQDTQAVARAIESSMRSIGIGGAIQVRVVPLRGEGSTYSPTDDAIAGADSNSLSRDPATRDKEAQAKADAERNQGLSGGAADPSKQPNNAASGLGSNVAGSTSGATSLGGAPAPASSASTDQTSTLKAGK